jgi:hypothetical protein
MQIFQLYQKLCSSKSLVVKIYKREIETMNEDVNLQIKYEEEDQKIPSSKSLAKK